MGQQASRWPSLSHGWLYLGFSPRIESVWTLGAKVIHSNLGTLGSNYCDSEMSSDQTPALDSVVWIIEQSSWCKRSLATSSESLTKANSNKPVLHSTSSNNGGVFICEEFKASSATPVLQHLVPSNHVGDLQISSRRSKLDAI